MLDKTQQLEEGDVEVGQPTIKAQEYVSSLKQELYKPGLKVKRRAEIEEDLAKVAHARFIKIRGVVHYVLDEGPVDGVPVILVHGWDCSSFWWHNVTPILNKMGYRTINYDFRGHGFTDDNPIGDDDYSIETMVEDIEALRIFLGLNKFHMATFSLGAVISTAYAALYPQQVLSLSCFNFGLFNFHPLTVKVMPRVLHFAFSKMLRKLDQKNWRLLYYYCRLTLAKNPIDSRDILYGMLSLKCCSPRANLNSLSSIMSKQVLDKLPKWAAAVQTPTLLVPGSHDQVIGKKIPKNLAKIMPNCTYFEMPHCGHLILAEFPGHVSSMMDMFMSRASIR